MNFQIRVTSFTVIMAILLPMVAWADSAFEKCGEAFFPSLVDSIENLGFAWVSVTDLLTSKNPKDPNSRLLYSSEGALALNAMAPN